MGLWVGSNPSMQAKANGLDAEREMALAHRLAVKAERKIISGAKFIGRETADVARAAQRGATQVVRSVTSPQARFGVGKSVGQAVLAGQQQRPTFSREQQMLGEMFGQGEKIWGTNQQPVTINNDLNSSRSDPFDETAGMFGFGGQGEKSGLF
ncbi:hypothetical protein LCGC14_0622400 [marine sediment metagenome]|uniref:Uncharacterized protein n=1 Tax=marine sediment metagenome TaxID=412755 RepID=A0A0F9R9B4_9ZZZZ